MTTIGVLTGGGDVPGLNPCIWAGLLDYNLDDDKPQDHCVQPLTLSQWLPVLVAPVLLVAAEETRKVGVRRHRRPPRADRPGTSGPPAPEAPGRGRLALAEEIVIHAR